MEEDFLKRARRFYDERWRTESPREKPSDIVAEAVSIIPPGETLDLGAGDGRNAMYLARRGFPVTAVDFSEEAVRIIRERAEKENLPMQAVLADAKTWKPEHSYHVIICTHLLQLFKDDTARELLSRIQAATSEGGWNVIDAWINEGDQFKLNGKQGNFYLARGELPGLYKGWKVVLYDESNASLYKKLPNGRPLQNVTARLIAQKPAE
jgi:tellurite methyltransferase